MQVKLVSTLVKTWIQNSCNQFETILESIISFDININ